MKETPSSSVKLRCDGGGSGHRDAISRAIRVPISSALQCRHRLGSRTINVLLVHVAGLSHGTEKNPFIQIIEHNNICTFLTHNLRNIVLVGCAVVQKFGGIFPTLL